MDVVVKVVKVVVVKVVVKVVKVVVGWKCLESSLARDASDRMDARLVGA